MLFYIIILQKKTLSPATGRHFRKDNGGIYYILSCSKLIGRRSCVVVGTKLHSVLNTVYDSKTLVANTNRWITQTSMRNTADEKNGKDKLLSFAFCLSCRPVSQYLFNCFRECSGSTTVTGSTLSRRHRLRPASKCCQTWVRCSRLAHCAIFVLAFH